MKSEDCEQSFFPEFTKQISDYTGKDIINALTPDFTTTTPVSFAVGQLTIMSTMKHYFNYRCMVAGCGFSLITIEGSIEDWTKILDKLTFLTKYKFEWFTEKVISTITEIIIETKKGNVDTQFWKEMIRIKDGHGFYNPGYVDGWFTSFFHSIKMVNVYMVAKYLKKLIYKMKCKISHLYLKLLDKGHSTSSFGQALLD